MSREPSIGRRILLLLLLLQSLVTGILTVGVVIYIRRQMLAAFDSELQRRMTTVLAMAQTADEKPGGIEFNLRPDLIKNEDVFVVWDARGQPIGSSSNPSDFLRPIIDSPEITFFHVGNRTYRGRSWHSVPLLDQESEEQGESATQIPVVNLVYARPADTFHDEVLKVTTIAIAASCIWMTLSSIVAWLSVSIGLVPLKELAAEASLITERSWSFEPSAGLKAAAELRPLVEALQSLIARLRTAFDRERTFVSDAAHELKTAVAIQKSTLQVTANGPQSISDYHRGFERALSDVDRLETLVSRMLSLASAESSTSQNGFARIALEETLTSACEQVAPLARVRAIKLQTNITGPSIVSGEAELLTSLWIATIENAIQHSPRGSYIDVSLETAGPNSYRVIIRDRGEGIAAEHLPRIFDRFYRVDRSRSRETGGYGLGLAIAKAIVQLHNGTIHIESTVGTGTTVEIRIPTVLKPPV